jgi:hypothetical protein
LQTSNPPHFETCSLLPAEQSGARFAGVTRSGCRDHASCMVGSASAGRSRASSSRLSIGLERADACSRPPAIADHGNGAGFHFINVSSDFASKQQIANPAARSEAWSIRIRNLFTGSLASGLAGVSSVQALTARSGALVRPVQWSPSTAKETTANERRGHEESWRGNLAFRPLSESKCPLWSVSCTADEMFGPLVLALR